MKYAAPFILLLVAGCSAEPALTASQVTSATQGCLSTGAKISQCDCYVGELQKRLGTDDITRAELAAASGTPLDPKIATIINEANAACKGK